MTTLGVDVGTGSTKGVLVDADGTVLGSAVRKHTVERPHPGHVEMDAAIWWEEFVGITRELLADAAEPPAAVGVSGMGPCVLFADAYAPALRPAILFGVDTRASEQLARIC
jgi:xylulokinase